MTVKEFYHWACENNLEDYDIEIQHRSGAGYHYGRDSLNHDRKLFNEVSHKGVLSMGN